MIALRTLENLSVDERRLLVRLLEEAGRTRPQMTLDDLFEVWWRDHVEINCTPNTRSSYLAVWSKHVRPRLGRLALADIGPRRVDRFKADLVAAGLGAALVHTSLAILSGMFTCGVRWEYVDRNPVDAIKIPAPRRRHHVRISAPPTVESMRRALLDAGRTRDAVLVATLAYSGLRPGEARALKWGDIRERTLLVERAADMNSIKSTKTRRIRTVRLLAPLSDDLSRWRRATNAGDEDLVFPGAGGRLMTGNAWNYWRKRVFTPTARVVGAGERPYDLRHTFASLLIASGATVVDVAGQLGHDPTLTLGTYAHTFSEFDMGSRPDPAEAIMAARRELDARRGHVDDRSSPSVAPGGPKNPARPHDTAQRGGGCTPRQSAKSFRPKSGGDTYPDRAPRPTPDHR